MRLVWRSSALELIVQIRLKHSLAIQNVELCFHFLRELNSHLSSNSGDERLTGGGRTSGQEEPTIARSAAGGNV